MVQGREIKEFTAVSQTKTIKTNTKISSQELGMLSHVMT